MKLINMEIDGMKVTLIVDLERSQWCLLQDGSCDSGYIGSDKGNLERTHHNVVISGRDYELVFDCDDEHTHWDSWQLFDYELQKYALWGNLDNEDGHGKA